MSATSSYTQAHRFARIDFYVESRQDKGDFQEKLLLVSFEGSEGLSELFHFRVEAVAPIETNFDPESVLGRQALLTFGIGNVRDSSDSRVRKFLGIIRSIRELREHRDFIGYELELVPPAWTFSQNRRFRILQDKPLQDAIEVLLPNNVSFPTGFSSLQRNYCVQYDESDFACAMRLLEESGCYFYFQRETDLKNTPSVKLCVRDDSTVGNEPQKIKFNPYVDGAMLTRPHVWEFGATRSMTASSVDVVNRAFQTPATDFSRSETIPDELNTTSNGKLPLKPHGCDDIAIREYPSGHVKYFDSTSSAGVIDEKKFESNVKDTMAMFSDARAGELALQSMRFDGASNWTHLAPGYPFQLDDHPRATGEYMVTHIVHSLRLAPFVSTPFEGATDDSKPYENRFTAIPRTLKYRTPRRTPRPRIQGYQTAVVIGSDGKTETQSDQIYTDIYGRVRVRFLWCENGFNSCWIRVVHSWAGKKWGSQFIPRIGQEVAVGFENGDPDCPLIFGGVYNGDNLPPHDPTKFKDVAGIMSCTNRSTIAEHPFRFTGVAIKDERDHEILHLRSAETMVQDAGRNVVVAAPQAIDTYVGYSSVRLVGGTLGYKLPASDYLGCAATIDASAHAGAWPPTKLDRPLFNPFVVDANFGNQIDVRFGGELKFCGQAYQSYGGFLAKAVNALPDWASSIDNRMGLSIGKVEQVSGQRATITNYFDFSEAAQHIIVSGQLPSEIPKLTPALDKAVLAARLTLTVLAGVNTLELGSTSRSVAECLSTATKFIGTITANVHIAEASLAKIAACKNIATAASTLFYACAALGSNAMSGGDYQELCAALPEAIKEAKDVLDVAGDNPTSDLGQKSDTYTYSERNHLLEAGKLFSVSANQSLFSVQQFYVHSRIGLLVSVGADPLHQVRFAADDQAFTVHSGNELTGAKLRVGEKEIQVECDQSSLLMQPKRILVTVDDVADTARLEVRKDSITGNCGIAAFKMTNDSIEWSIGACKLTMSGDEVKIEAPGGISLESALKISLKAPKIEGLP